MKRIAAVAGVLLALLSGSAAYATGPLGTLPPEPEDTGTMAVGGGYLLREVKLVPRKSTYSPITARQSHYYIQATDASYGWEWALRLGAADFKDGVEFNSGLKPFVGIGLKGYLYGDQSTDLGLVASLRGDVYSRYRVSGVTVAPGLAADVRVKDLLDASAGLMAHARFDRLTVYGGPALQYTEAKVYRTTLTPSRIESTEDTYYRNDSTLSLATGVSWQRVDQRLGIEASASGGGYSIGVEAAVAF